VAERVLLASPGKRAFLGILVPRVSLDPKVSPDLRDPKDRLGKVETKVHKVQLDKWVLLESQVLKAYLVRLVQLASLDSLVCCYLSL